MSVIKSVSVGEFWAVIHKVHAYGYIFCRSTVRTRLAVAKVLTQQHHTTTCDGVRFVYEKLPPEILSCIFTLLRFILSAHQAEAAVGVRDSHTVTYQQCLSKLAEITEVINNEYSSSTQLKSLIKVPVVTTHVQLVCVLSTLAFIK